MTNVYSSRPETGPIFSYFPDLTFVFMESFFPSQSNSLGNFTAQHEPWIGCPPQCCKKLLDSFIAWWRTRTPVVWLTNAHGHFYSNAALSSWREISCKEIFLTYLSRKKGGINLPLLLAFPVTHWVSILSCPDSSNEGVGMCSWNMDLWRGYLPYSPFPSVFLLPISCSKGVHCSFVCERNILYILTSFFLTLFLAGTI